MEECNDHYLGLDLSTQSLKVIISNELRVIETFYCNFEKDFPEYETNSGILKNSKGEIFSNVLMFLDALDSVLTQIKNSGYDLKKIKALSGSAQQHGSIYWKKNSKEKLKQISAMKSLKNNFLDLDLLASNFCPIWMDNSTKTYVKKIEENFSPETLFYKTGSKAYERFTGPQIMKIAKEKSEIYNQCEHISLISSFCAEVLIGDFCGIDYSDASGMNLLNINKLNWDDDIMNFYDENLSAKLSNPIPSYEKVGLISNYFVEKYGFSRECLVIAFSGDNPCSLIGAGKFCNEIILSFGTSDTIFTLIPRIDVNLEKINSNVHLLISPENIENFMMMLCTRNGAFTRKYYLDKYAENSWKVLEEKILSSPPGNNGIIGFFYEYPEIIPKVDRLKFSEFYKIENDEIKHIPYLSDETILRSLFEGKILSLYNNIIKIRKKIKKILITGGGSNSLVFPQIIADIFNVEVFKSGVEETAAYGALLRAIHGMKIIKLGKFIPIYEIFNQIPYEYELVAKPINTQVYSKLKDFYGKIEDSYIEN
jgi:xylulokinase